MKNITKVLGLALLSIIFAMPVSAQFGRGLFDSGLRIGYQNPQSKRAPTPEEVRAKKVNDDIEKIKKTKKEQDLIVLNNSYTKQMEEIGPKIREWNQKLLALYEAGFDNNIQGLKEAAGYIARLIKEEERLGDILDFSRSRYDYLYAKKILDDKENRTDKGIAPYIEGDRGELFTQTRLEIMIEEYEEGSLEKNIKEKYAPKKN